MTRVNLTKYGFVKSPEDDFVDDGARFVCFRLSDTGRARISKCVSGGQIYLSIRCDGAVPHELYSKLPHYKAATWDYNGIPTATLEEPDLEAFHSACVAYETEYLETENSMTYPTVDELMEMCSAIHDVRTRELQEIEKLLGQKAAEAALKLDKFEWLDLKDCMTALLSRIEHFSPETLVPKIVGTGESFDLMRRSYDLEPSLWYKKAIRYLTTRLI